MLAAHAQKGLPAFGIYGKDVLDTDDTSIPEDVKTKLLRFGWVAVAVASIRGRSYLQIGSGCMAIAGSFINADLFEEYLGMRVESVDEVEILRRMDEEIYHKEEFEKALLSSSFDWEGAREPYILATENDNLNGVYKFGY